MSRKLWFGGLGFVLGGPIGALIGFAIGAIFDAGDTVLSMGDTDNSQQSSEGSSRRSYQKRATQGDIRVSILVLIACVIKADGRVLKSEINYIKPFLLRNYGEDGAKDALQLLKQLLDKPIDPVSIAQQIGQNVNYSTCLELVHLLLDLAHADGEMCDSEKQVIELIAANMHISPGDMNSLFSLYRKQQDPNWAYQALQISPSATNDEVKKAYRRMAMKYHPDKVANAGEEIKEQATAKFRAINEAYEAIKSQRGMA